MMPMDCVYEDKTNISTKEAKGRQKKNLSKRFIKSDGTNSVLNHAFPSTLISQPCFLCISCVAKYILMAKSWKTNRILSFT